MTVRVAEADTEGAVVEDSDERAVWVEKRDAGWVSSALSVAAGVKDGVGLADKQRVVEGEREGATETE